MKENCILKSGAYGVTLIMNPTAPIEEVLREICMKFATQRKFFGKTNLILTITGRQLSTEELEAVIQSIEYNTDVKIDLIAEKNQARDKRTLDMRDRFYRDEIRKNAKIILGPVREGETIRSDASVIVLGNVEDGSEIIASGNIIVTGFLEGYASCGMPNHNDCFIYAGEFLSESLTIGEHEGELPPKKGGLFHKKNKRTEGEVLLYRQDHFIITNLNDEIITNHFAKKYNE